MDPTNDLATRTRTALSEHHLSLCEHFVLCAVGHRINLPPAALAHRARALSDGDPRGAFEAATYEAALASCLQRGLLVVLGSGHFDEGGRRIHLRECDLAREEGFDDYSVGQVDFTRAGYELHRAVLREVFGPRDR
jgi:hypothetical protein